MKIKTSQNLVLEALKDIKTISALLIPLTIITFINESQTFPNDAAPKMSKTEVMLPGDSCGSPP